MQKDNNGLSDFMKDVYINGDVKDLNEAFEEYPCEEEWHEGNIENILKEDILQYGAYEIGDIVFVEKFNYNNGMQGSRHFFVIIDQNNTAVPIENFAMLISSKIDKIKYKENILIKKDSKNGLNKDSIVKTDVVYKILHNQVLFKLGSIDIDKVEEYKKHYYINNNVFKIF